MPQDKRSKRLKRRVSEFKERVYRNTLAEQYFLMDPHAAREMALTLSPELESDAAIKKAFATFGLDPGRPHHWRKLLAELADVLFGERQPGPRARWNFGAYAQLLSDVDEVRTKHPQRTSWKILTDEEPYRTRYRGLSASSIRARHRDARNPRINKLLATIRKDRLKALLQLISKKWKSSQHLTGQN